MHYVVNINNNAFYYIIMKSVILLLLVTSFSFAQSNFRLNKAEYFAASIVIDPRASIKEKGLNIGAEIEYVGSVYVKASVTNFAVLKDNYTDIIGSAGLSFTSGYFEKVRYYVGARSGIIKRAVIYPTLGVECGIDIMITDSAFIGLRSTYDRRGDAKYYEGNEWVYSGFIKIGIKF